MEAIECPYCNELNHTSCPDVMAACAYCGARFAEVCTENETLVILDRSRPDAWGTAEDLMAEWQEHGQLEKEAIVDRRLGDAAMGLTDRRRRPSGGLGTMQMM
ncbi:MAG: hypothetical protein Q7K29_05410 [Thermoleophilia bacterium]|nr:hypothetical protein [Thermoleophilia bacterium]